MTWDQGLLTSHLKNSAGMVLGSVHHENHSLTSLSHLARGLQSHPDTHPARTAARDTLARPSEKSECLTNENAMTFQKISRAINDAAELAADAHGKEPPPRYFGSMRRAPPQVREAIAY